MNDAILIALRRLNCPVWPELHQAIIKNIGPQMMNSRIPKGHEEEAIRSLMRGMCNSKHDGEESFSA